MQRLQGVHLNRVFDHRVNPARGGNGGGERRDARNVVANRGATDVFLILKRLATEWRVDDHVHFPRLHQVHNVRSPLVHFVDRLRRDAGSLQRR